MEKAREEYIAYQNDDNALHAPPMCGIVPLMTFGPKDNKLMATELFASPNQQTGQTTFHTWAGGPTCAWVAEPTKTQTINYTDWRIKDVNVTVDPSYIGIDCRSLKNILTYNLWFTSNAGSGVADDKPTIGNVFKEMNGGYTTPNPLLMYATPYQSFVNPCGNVPATEPVPGFPGLYNPAPYYTSTFTSFWNNDVSLIRLGRVPEALACVPLEGHWVVNFQGSMSAGFVAPDDYKAGTEVSEDRWHHLLLSVRSNVISTKGSFKNNGGNMDLFKLDGGTVESSAEIFISLDDRNLVGKQLSYFTNAKDNKTNKVMTPNAYVVFNYLHDTYHDHPPKYDTGSGYYAQIDRQGWAPASYKFDPPPFPIGKIQIPGDADTVKHIEMAELQLFTGVPFDTANVQNRRFFVTSAGKPADMSLAEQAFRKKPDVQLHTSSKWKKAVNTGSLGKVPLPGITYVGDIKTYKPDPSLHGKQSP